MEIRDGREQVEEQLRADLLVAQGLLEAAGVKLSDLSRLSIESGVTSEETVTLEWPRQLRVAARKRYLTALRRFADYVAHGKLPEQS
jgi:hypothetical protein